MADRSGLTPNNTSHPEQIDNILAAIFNATFVGLAAFDDQTRIVISNPAFSSMIANSSASECVGKTISEIIGPDANDLESAIKAILDTGKPRPSVHVATKIPHSGFVSHWRFNLFPINDQGGSRQVAAIAVTTNYHESIEEYFLSLMADLSWIRQQMSRDPSVLHDQPDVLGPIERTGLLDGPPDDAASLSPRELEVLRLVASGKTNKEIAVLIHVTIKTVDTYRTRAMLKLDLHSACDMVRYAVRNHLVSP